MEINLIRKHRDRTRNHPLATATIAQAITTEDGTISIIFRTESDCYRIDLCTDQAIALAQEIQTKSTCNQTSPIIPQDMQEIQLTRKNLNRTRSHMLASAHIARAVTFWNGDTSIELYSETDQYRIDLDPEQAAAFIVAIQEKISIARQHTAISEEMKSVIRGFCAEEPYHRKAIDLIDTTSNGQTLMATITINLRGTSDQHWSIQLELGTITFPRLRLLNPNADDVIDAINQVIKPNSNPLVEVKLIYPTGRNINRLLAPTQAQMIINRMRSDGCEVQILKNPTDIIIN